MPAIVLVALIFCGALVSANSGWGPEHVAQHSGFITVNKLDRGSHIFYWLFESRGNPATDPLVLWLTGGPGCFTGISIFFENGPYKMNSTTGNVDLNPFAWNRYANMLYVDQPVGTGFSFTDHPDDYDDNEDQISQHLYEFLQEFYVKFPQYKKLDFFIAGVSYAGHFVPALGNRIFQALKNKEGPFDIPLKGFAIGNGLTNAYIQYMDYANYSFDKGLIDEKTRNYIQNSLLPVCEQAILQNKTDEQTDDCNAIFETIQEKALRDFNTYDVRDPCVNKPLCYDFSKLGDLMTNANFRSAIGVSPNGHYSECDTTVYSKLASIDWWQNCDKYIPELLEAGIRVLVYNG